MNLFFILLKASIKSQMQYKANFIISSLVSGLTIFSDFLLIAILLLKFENILDWTLYEVAIIYSIIEFGFGSYRLFFNGLDNFEDLIITGKFDALLIRPISTLLHVMIQRFDLRRIGIIIQSLAVGIFGIANSNLHENKYFLLLYGLLLFSSFIITVSINVILATIAFWTGKNKDIVVLAFYSTRVAASFPLEIYNQFIKFLLTFIIPFSTSAYYPILFITKKSENVLFLFAPLMAIILIVPFALCFWSYGTKKYRSSGT